jgi:hypothetical protein
VLLIPLGFHALGTTVVVATAFRLSTQVEKPDPTTVVANVILLLKVE